MHYFRLRSRLHNMWSKNFYFSINAPHVRRQNGFFFFGQRKRELCQYPEISHQSVFSCVRHIGDRDQLVLTVKWHFCRESDQVRCWASRAKCMCAQSATIKWNNFVRACKVNDQTEHLRSNQIQQIKNGIHFMVASFFWHFVNATCRWMVSADRAIRFQTPIRHTERW